METPNRNEQSGGIGGGSVHPSGAPASRKGSGGMKTALLVVLIAGGVYLAYDTSRLHHSQRAMTTEIADLSTQMAQLRTDMQSGESSTARMMAQLSEARQTAGQASQELSRINRQFAQETQRVKSDLNRAIAAKADNTAVEAVKEETATKMEQVSTDVGGVKNDVGVVKSNLATTRSDLESTQRRLSDVNDLLSAAVAKNSTELAELRRKGERNYVEFTLARKNSWQKVEDISLDLTRTDPKNGKFNIQISVDDSKLEKKDRTINEPVQFLVGKNHVRYELVVNWVQKDRAGGYLSVPKDKVLAAELQAGK